MDTITLQLIGGCIATIIPLLFVCVMVKDVNSRRIMLYFCWGTLAGLLSYTVNTSIAEPEQAGRVVTAIAPIVEEICKGLPVLLFLSKKRFPQITESIVYSAMASGVGFSIQESIYYFSVSAGAAEDLMALIVRTLTTALMHGMTTAMIGMGLLILQKHRHILLPIIFSLFALSASIHALFNLLLPTSLSVIAMLMPIGLFFAGLAFLGNIKDSLLL